MQLTAGDKRARPGHVGEHLPLLVSVSLVALATVGHYLTPTSSPQFHDALRRVYYLPIVLVGIRYGAWAGTGIAATVVVAYLPHVCTDWGGGLLEQNLNRTFEMVMYLVVGLLTGLLSDRERAARTQAESALEAACESSRAARTAARNLLEAQEQLHRADRLATLGLLSAGLAHEVRNPLGSLKGIADMLGDDFPEGHPRRELVEILDKEVNRLERVVGTFLDNARPRGRSGPAPVDAAARHVFALLGREAEKRQVRLDLDVDPAEITVPLPEEQLRQVLTNIVLNALEALNGRGGGGILVRARMENGGVVITVDDDGPGFPAELDGRTPEPFFTTRDHGTGLGLAICRQIVESHRGRLCLARSPRGGARVAIDFSGTPE